MWGRESPVSRFFRKFPHFRPILDSAERRRVESSKCRALCLCWRFYRWLNWARLAGPDQPGLAACSVLAWSQRKILDFCSEENQRQRRKHVRTVITFPIMMIIIRINKLWCQQSDKPYTEIKKNFTELSLSLNNCMWFKPNTNTGQRSKNLRGQLKVK